MTRPGCSRKRRSATAWLALPIALAACQTTPPPPAPSEPAAHPPVAAAPDDASRTLPTQSAPPSPATAAPIAGGLKELFPGVRVDAAAKLVEFDAVLSPMLAPDPRAPLFYLELVACTPDTREHESLIVSRARPSHIHAAMLIIGLKPGEPGRWKMESDRLVPIDATGDRVQLRFAFQGTSSPNRTIEVDPLSWIASARDERGLAEALPSTAASGAAGRPADGWVFAGSRIVSGARAMGETPTTAPPEVYEADETGTVIGLTSFGSEMISWSRTISPDAGVDAPEWVAKMDGLPAAGAPIVVRIRPAH